MQIRIWGYAEKENNSMGVPEKILGYAGGVQMNKVENPCLKTLIQHYKQN